MGETKNRHYIIFVANNPPQNMGSTVDLIASYEEQIGKMRKSGRWDTPIRLVDEEGEVAAVYHPNAILGIVRGFIVPDQQPEPEKKT
jgi:hypothetical protein